MSTKIDNIASRCAGVAILGVLALLLFLVVTTPGPWSFHAEKIERVAASKYLTFYGPTSAWPIAVYRNVHDVKIEEGLDPESTNSNIFTRYVTTARTDKGALMRWQGSSRPLASNLPPLTESLSRAAEGQHRKAQAREVAKLIKGH